MTEEKNALPKQYFVKRLKSKILTLCFSRSSIDRMKIKEPVYYHLAKAIFFSDPNYKSRFVHWNETQNEMSLFIDKKSCDFLLKSFPDEVKQFMIYDDTIFVAFQLYTDENDIFNTGITSFISTKLAEQNIPIIYCNSFNNNYILVPETYQTQAMNILKKIASGEADSKEEDDAGQD